jgi:hypothetical protein
MRKRTCSLFVSAVLVLIASGCARTGEIAQPSRTQGHTSTPEPRLFPIKSGEKLGFVDSTGRIVIKPQFDDVFAFSEGLALVELGGRFGYIDGTGQVVIDPQFSFARPFSEGLAFVRSGSHGCYIDKTGKCVIQSTPPIEYRLGADFSEGLASVMFWSNADYSSGECFIDKTGKSVIGPKVDSAGSFSEGRARVVINRKVGYIDITGRLVIEPQFDMAQDFKEGLAAVRAENSGATLTEAATGQSSLNLNMMSMNTLETSAMASPTSS